MSSSIGRLARWALPSLLLLASACGDDMSSTGGAGSGAGGTGGAGGASAVAPALGLNDVSVLIPLPKTIDAPGYLGSADAGARGVLLPQDVFDAIPTFPVVPSQGLLYDRMRVLAVRFDGCSGGVGQCEPEIRLVLQPVNNSKARDSALHLFFRLTQDEMTEVVAQLRDLRALAPEVTTEGPLDVHPALAAQGVEGPYGAALRELLLAHAGEDNLVRVTFFLRAPPTNEVWFFGGFDRAGTKLTPIDVVGVGTDPQRVILTKTSTTYAYDLTPLGTTPEDGSVLTSSATAEAASDAERAAAFASFLRVQNPSTYVPDELPCAGCHLASFVTADASTRFGLDAGSLADNFTSTRDLSMRGGSAGNPSSLRAFGWFGDEPMIAQRTINDSAKIADDLEARYPAP